MIIYNSSGVQKADVQIDTSTKLIQSFNGVDKVNAVFTVSDYIALEAGDYITWRGVNYAIFSEPSIKKQKVTEFRYNIDFLAPKFAFQNAIMVLDDNTEFPLFGNLTDQVNFILDNINRVLTGTYVLGTAPETVNKNVSYGNTDCLQALIDVIKLWDCEYELVGNTINIYNRIENITGLRFQFKEGLKGVERKKLRENELCTRLYAFGSTKNITFEYGYKRLRVDPIEANINLFGLREQVKIFEDVYPQFEGNVTSVTSNLVFTAADLPFDLNTPGVMLPGQPAKIAFNSGDLAGYEFEISSFNSSTNTFTLIEYDDGNGLKLPNDTFKPSADGDGDLFTLFGINMPDEYIAIAEQELIDKANNYMAYASYPTVVYDIQPNIGYMRVNTIEINLGDVITVFDNDLGINIEARVTDFSQSLAEEYLYTIKVGNRLREGFVLETNSKTSSISKTVVGVTNEFNTEINFLKSKQINIESQEDIFITNRLLLAETKGQNYMTEGLQIFPNYSDNPNGLFISGASFHHFTINEGGLSSWVLPFKNFILQTTSSKYFIYAKCNKEDLNGEWIVSTSSFFTDDGGSAYFFLIGVVTPVTDGARILNALFVGAGTNSVNNITQVIGGTDSPEVIAQKYHSVDNVNQFTDALYTKLVNLTATGSALLELALGDPFILKTGGSTPGTLEMNDVCFIRWDETNIYFLLYDGVGLPTNLTSYTILNQWTIDTLYT